MNGEFRDVGEVMSLNVVKMLGMDESNASKVKRVLNDEFQLMGSHFSMIIAEMQDHFDAELRKIKSDFVWLDANKAKVAIVATGLLSIGAFFGHLV